MTSARLEASTSQSNRMEPFDPDLDTQSAETGLSGCCSSKWMASVFDSLVHAHTVTGSMLEEDIVELCANLKFQ